MTFDELRDAFPDLGFALYAIEPRGIVTLEVHDNGHVYPFVGWIDANGISASAQDVIDMAFPPQTVELFNTERPQQTESVFD